MVDKLAAVKGMNDILPPDSARWEWLEEKLRATMRRYGYRNIRTPILEPTGLFVRGTGETTDIVEKEMYSFVDRLNGDDLTLRPENTPGVVRAAIEHNLTYDGGKRLYYVGPMFRHERPQRGRYRQFYQAGAESLGFAGPEMDAELMLMASDFFGELGLTNIRVEMNSLGLPAERLTHRADLIAHFQKHLSELDQDAVRRLETNPLRILDTKNPSLQTVVQGAPQLINYLGEKSLRHFETLKAILTSCKVDWVINPRLVRGLDYYNHSVFEFVSDELGAQGTVCAGGRYDGLFEVLGGKPTPAVGWGMGLERVLQLVDTHSGKDHPRQTPDAFAVILGTETLGTAMIALQALRAHGLNIQMHSALTAEPVSLKSQLKRADASGARFALIFGPDEVAENSVTVKALRDGEGGQVKRALGAVSSWADTLRFSK